MNVYWLEQTAADVPEEDQWLGASELLALERLRFAKRRKDWRLGRWTAKLAVADCLDLPTDIFALANIEIRAADSGAPEVVMSGNRDAPITISLSHRATTALCSVVQSEISLGCDIEMVERRSDAFVDDYFTADEKAFIERASELDRPLLVTLVWSAKESALKALQTGLRLDTNCVDVDLAFPLPRPTADGWSPLQIRYAGTQIFRGWWGNHNNMVRTIVSDHSLDFPILSCACRKECCLLPFGG